MDAVNWLLINGANALLGLWELLKGFLGGALTALDARINPVLSPLLAGLNRLSTALGDAVYALLGPLPLGFSLTILSVLAGVAALICFRYLSNQAAIGRALDDIKANLLALKLYKDELRVTFRSQARLLWAILRLQRHMLRPVLVMLPPMLLGLAQMGLRHQWRPLRPGERTLIKMRLHQRGVGPAEVKLEPSEGVEVEVGPVPGGGELVWRVRGGKIGRHTLRFRIGDGVIEKELVVDTALRRISAVRIGSHWAVQLLHPAERRLPADSPADSIEIVYPDRDSWFYGTNYWVLTFLVISMLTALILRPLFRVRF